MEQKFKKQIVDGSETIEQLAKKIEKADISDELKIELLKALVERFSLRKGE